MYALDNIEKILLQKDEWEDLYRSLYEQNPDAYEKTVTGWEDFCSRFEKSMPPQSPTVIKEFLSEQEFFQEDQMVNCFKNMRYCPPFLHKLEFIKIVYALQGSSFFYLNNKKYELEEGNFCIVSPGVEQAVFTKDERGAAVNILLRASTFAHTYSTLLTEQEILSDFFWKITSTNYCNRVLFFHAKPDLHLKRAALRLFYEVRLEPHPSSLLQESYVSLFLGEGIRRHRDDLILLEGLDESVYRIPAILQDIKEHLADITLEQLAKKWKMKEEHIRYELKMETGYSFPHLLTDLRLQKAAQLLTETKDSVETVMEAVGCTDSAAFYRNFKKRYKTTPQGYRSRKNDA